MRAQRPSPEAKKVCQMETKFLTSEQTAEAGRILGNGGVGGIPTETVYGLAANALDGDAVAKIFEAKGRPQDNPLIVHIADLSELDNLAAFVPPVVYDLADAFWPGPLTIILEKSELIPNEVSAGLSTVAIRMPSHPVAREIIRAAGVPLAAPSANTSGKPSPTAAAHVMQDMTGKIDAVVDGGECTVGVESTVITLCTRRPRLLRPGGITPDDLSAVLGDLVIDDAVLGELGEDSKPASPGMKYKHYSPNANVVLVEADRDKFIAFVNEKASQSEGVVSLAFDDEADDLNCAVITFGDQNDDAAHAAKLFAALRECDDRGFKTVYVHAPKAEGVGLAVMNRLLRAAEYEVVDL